MSLLTVSLRRRLARLLEPWLRRLRGRTRAVRQDSLTAVEYEAVTLIAYEGRNAYARAREQARYCRRRGSQEGVRFWSAVADEIALRTKGSIPEER